MITASSLHQRRLLTRVGNRLRRVHDFRCAWRDGTPVCTHLVLGRRGWLEELGFRRSAQDGLDLLACGASLEIRDREIVVTDA
jgi:hypothetical protein